MARKRTVRIEWNSPAILGFALICLAAMGINHFTGGWANRRLFSVYRASLRDPLTYIRMVAHVFGHSGWEHLLSNMMYILLLGPLLEEKYGPTDLVIVMFITALLTGLVEFIFFPGTALLGASGIVFAMILLASITSTQKDTIPVTFLLVAVLYIGQQVWQAVTVRENISYMAHILGGATGAVLGFALKSVKRSKRA
ncbi:MAG: rhomboid family intramembrane serine protease [Clostridia bacterium]|nr:rhomboid family intramembrane serine protease [Clostridia bacterium]